MTISKMMLEIGVNAKNASAELSFVASKKKDDALSALMECIFQNKSLILNENKKDIELSKMKNLSDSMLDRLYLDEDRLFSIIKSVEEIKKIPDPVGTVIANYSRPNGLSIKRIRSPLGVVGVIFESRPNVTIDAGALCLKSGNASILRCGSESFNTSQAFGFCFKKALIQANLSQYCVQLVPTVNRAAVTEMLKMTEYLDVIVPRGGKSLVKLIQNEARVPVFAHFEGIVHIYVHVDADPQTARKVILNSKTRRPGICGAVECILVDYEFIEKHGTGFITDLIAAGVIVKVKGKNLNISGTILADQTDWGKEFLSLIVSVKSVNGVQEAITHIKEYGSNHTDCIITENDKVAGEFFAKLDSAILMRNASTQFADGGEFGFGGEIGIATGKIHARGPIGVEQLTTFKYIIEGNGQLRG